MKSLDEKGSSYLIVVLLIVVFAVIVFAGLFVRNRENKTAVNTTVAKTSQSQYCSTYGGVCFSYPSSWEVKPVVDTLTPTNSHPGVYLVNSADPTITPTWSTIATLPAGVEQDCNTATCSDSVLELSQTPLKNIPSVLDVQAIFENKCTNCGTGIYQPQEFLISETNLSSYGFKLNTNIQLTTSPFQPTFNITKTDGSVVKQAFEVSDDTLQAKNEHYGTLATAPNWFQLPGVEQAHQILLSLRQN
jgi:hypothetical protein